MGSLFDGVGGFPLAAIRNGVTPIWASEIEAFPIEVTKARFPSMAHVGDITKLEGAKLPPVDILCGGSPCQDLSIAGQRAGLAGERSGLFMEQVRIAKEMRIADEQRGIPGHLIRPRYLIWENVPGAFSSADGEDFRAVLEEIIRIKDGSCHVPRPDNGTWQSAGAIVLGDECSLAWRVLDAQYWGVAQRRRRIFLVADFGGRTAPQILFEQDCLLGNPAQSRGQRQGTAASAKGRPDDPGGTCLNPQDVIAFAANQRDEVRDLRDIAGALGAQPGMKQQTFVAEMSCLNRWDTQQSRVFLPEGVAPTLAGADGGGRRNPAGLLLTAGFCAGAGPAAGGVGYSEELSPTLKASESGTNMVPAILCLNDQGGQCMNVSQDIAGTLRAQMHSHQPLVLANQQGGAEIGEGVCPTITSAAGTSGNNQPVLFENHPKDGRYNGPLGVAPTLAARMGTGGNNVPLVGTPAPFSPDSGEVICIAGNTIDREPQNGGNGLGCQPDLAYTLTGADRHAVFSRQRSDEFLENGVVATQSARQHKDATDLICQPYQETVGTIGYSDHKGVNNQFVSEDKCIVVRHKLIRRLTPLECERLQGYPDGWTDIPGASDSARYKALGNSVAIPCVDFVLRGIASVLRKVMEEQ
jgi:DNA (cytosine-5)-methyltransferase 1